MYFKISVFLLLVSLLNNPLFSQSKRIEGVRENTPAVFAFTNADIVSAPGKIIRGGTLVVRNGIIDDIGRRAHIPADAWIFDLQGKMIYPGFIDLYAHYGLPDSISYDNHVHWNPQVRSHFSSSEHFRPDPQTAAAMRAQGFVIVQSVPKHGLIKGHSTVVTLGDADANRLIIKNDAAHGVSFKRTGHRQADYPTSLMGAMALIRQTIIDAKWYQEAHQTFISNPAMERPEKNIALKALALAINNNTPFIFDTDDENDFLRAAAISNEFGINTIIMGSGKEYRRIDAVRNTRLPVIVPINFPDPPELSTPEQAHSVSLETLRHWYLAPENPGRLLNAKVQVLLSAHGSKNNFLKNLRTAIARGLSQKDALEALTTAPAQKLGIDARYGSLEKGKAASFFIADGNIFEHHSKITEVWIDGKQYPVEEKKPELQGVWEISYLSGLEDVIMEIGGNNNRLKGTLKHNDKTTSLEHLKYDNHRLTFHFTGDTIGLKGSFRLSASVGHQAMTGSGTDVSESFFTWKAKRISDANNEEVKHPKKEPALDLPERYPSMEYGITEIPEQPRHILVKNATIWTQSAMGKLESADMLVTNGVITSIGNNIETPLGATVIDASGMHLTSGLIDPHLHTSITGGVNETGSAITSETRIADVIHGDNVWIYRLLAGGITSATLFHGSANPIGGQNAVIKMRLGHLPDELLISDAAPGLKFALGENVKGMSTRYPNTRQGTEQIIKDALQAAKEYEKALEKQKQSQTGLPIRRDLQLEAILEVINGKRKAHVHAYRQDEMLMMMRLAEEYGFTIGSFEHTLEGYKIADELKEHGAAAVVWTDWSSFKVEAYDGILYNARLLNDVGVLTSLHSDNTQLATRMNWEAAKTMKTGVNETDAMNFITLHPAMIMGIDQRTGSLEPGKDADFVIWNGHPLSSFSIPQQTWVDGRKYFDRNEDTIIRKQVKQERAMIINHILNASHTKNDNHD